MFETCRRHYNEIKTLMYKSVHFAGSYYIGISQYTVQKNIKFVIHTSHLHPIFNKAVDLLVPLCASTLLLPCDPTYGNLTDRNLGNGNKHR